MPSLNESKQEDQPWVPNELQLIDSEERRGIQNKSEESWTRLEDLVELDEDRSASLSHH